ncbi:MAG: S41 family peptidase [Lachnospiraceae bacterium]|nr:S41 family peptidase [Lachnospiraceae bacterium]
MEENGNNNKVSFRSGLLFGLTIGLTVALIVGIFAVVKIKSISNALGSVLDLKTASKISVISKVIDDCFYDYDDRKLTVDDMRDGLYRGIVSSMDDKYAEYYSKEELEQEIIDNQGIYYGIGAYISLGEDDYPFLSGIMADTPAEKAGLRAGDVLVKVDDESTYGMTLDDVVSRVKGDDGTVVHLTIYREGENDYLEIDVTRGAVETLSVGYDMLENDIGYIQIVRFEQATVNQFTEAYEYIKENDAEGLIIDLRSNPGGLVSSVVGIADQILPEGLVFYELDAQGNRKEYRCEGDNAIDIPLVVLVDGYSASASEILSGAIRDHGIGTLVGEKTYGKGIVQDVKQLSDGSAVKLTVSAYYLPGGDNIQGTGIEPDVTVELDVDAYYDEGIDTQLDKAIEVMNEKVGQ